MKIISETSLYKFFCYLLWKPSIEIWWFFFKFGLIMAIGNLRNHLIIAFWRYIYIYIYIASKKTGCYKCTTMDGWMVCGQDNWNPCITLWEHRNEKGLLHIWNSIRTSGNLGTRRGPGCGEGTVAGLVQIFDQWLFHMASRKLDACWGG
jgi:hypothetical protein